MVGWLRQCVSHTKSPFIQPAQSFDEAVDVPVVLHDRQKAVSSTGPVHWQGRRFPSCVATPSTNNPDVTAKVKVSQGLIDGYLPRVRQRQCTTNQEIQKIVETTQRQTSHHRFRSSRKSRRWPRYHKLYRDSADHPTIQNAVKDPTGPILDRITVAPVGIQRQTPTIQSPQQPLEVTQTHYLIQWQMRSFDCTLSRQPVCEQTSGVLRHTERVQDDKVQKQDWKQSLEKKFCVPPARPRSCSRRRREVHSAVQADDSLTKSAIPMVEVLYVVMGCSETSVLSTRRRCGAKPPAVAAAAFEKTLRRLCSRLLRQRQDFEWSNSLQRCCGRPLCFLNGHLQ